MSKEKFDFYLDRKVTIWVREQHSIEAESKEEAKKEMIEAFKDNLCSESLMSKNGCMIQKPLWNPVIMAVNQRLNYFIVIPMNY